MSVEKKSLINNMTTTKKAIIATSNSVAPVVSAKAAPKVATKAAPKVATKFVAKMLAGKSLW